MAIHWNPHWNSSEFAGFVQVTCDVYHMLPIPLFTVDGATYSTAVEYRTSTSDTGWSVTLTPSAALLSSHSSCLSADC